MLSGAAAPAVLIEAAGMGCDSCAGCLQIFQSAPVVSLWFLFSFSPGVMFVVRVKVTASVWRGGHGVRGDGLWM